MKKFEVEKMTETRAFYTCTEKNKKGEKLVIEVYRATNDNGTIWKKSGFIDRDLLSYWSIQTYAYDTENNCFGLYNPQIKKINTLDFDWVLEATSENLEILLAETYKRFMSAAGKTATEKKMKHIEEVATSKGWEVFSKLPEGWNECIYGITAPCGTVLINNGKSIKSGLRKSALLLV